MGKNLQDGPSHQDLWRIGSEQSEFPFGYEAWVSDDGLVRMTGGRTEDRSLDRAKVLTPAQARKFGEDLIALSQSADEQRERLRGDDRWHVRPHPDRSDVFIVKRHLWRCRYTGREQYAERTFVQTEIRKARACDVCNMRVEAGTVVYREENPQAWATPNWRDVRICSSCIRGHGGAR